MDSQPLAFFTIDRGTASTTAALVGRLGGRFRLFGSAAQPAGLPDEPLLERLVDAAAGADPDALEGVSGWAGWARLEAASRAPGRVVIAAGSERRLGQLESAIAAAGWEITGRIGGDRIDPLQATELLLDETIDGVALAASDPPSLDERDRLAELSTLLAAVTSRRTELSCLLSGGAREYAERFGAKRVVTAPAPDPVPGTSASELRTAAAKLAPRRGSGKRGGSAPPDIRRGFRSSIESLAALLERRVEGVDVGHSAGTRVLATPDGLRADLVRADGALVPAAAMNDDRLLDGILRWSPIRGDPVALRDQLRNLRLAPWRDAAGDGARLRLSAARGALTRLDAAWTLTDEPDGRPGSRQTDLLVASGGAFAVAPPPAVALALVDTLRRPGGLAMFYDHARILGPLGTLDSETDRRRLLADLLDDALVPLGSAILATGLRPGRNAGTLRVTSDGAVSEVELVPGAVQLVDLAPGLAATAELETREGAWLGVRARRVAMDVAGGLGGLLVDTRDIPLRLPDRPERRREMLDSWQRLLWTSGEP
ncbi:MAG: hypothetical protein ACR2JZ_05480 [Candidatus Limnocylindrales bacterium]